MTSKGMFSKLNEILDKLPKCRFNGTQFSIILFVIRHTFGFQVKHHPLGNSFIANGIEIHKDQVKRELAKLIDWKVITVFDEGDYTKSRSIGINENLSEWSVTSGLKSPQGANSPPGVQEVTVPGDVLAPQDIRSLRSLKILNNTTKEPYLVLLDEYCELHKKFEYHLKRDERTAMQKMVSGGIPLEFILTSMREIFESKLEAGDNITSFIYYEKVIPDIWKRKNTVVPMIRKNSKHKTQEELDQIARELEEEMHEYHRDD